MGISSSGKRDRADSEGGFPSSPGRESGAFDFSKKNKFLYQPSVDDPEEYAGFKKFFFFRQDGSRTDGDFPPMHRTRASAITPGSTLLDTALPTVFKWEGGGKRVYIAGSFSQWKNKIPMVKSHGDFVTILELPEGEHQYKFFVDGQWQHNPHEPTLDNGMGSKNNVVFVKKSDFEVFEALAMDSTNSGSSPKSKASDVSGSPPGDYSQEIPQRKPYEKSTGPPILPPHLLQVILNKDTPLQCEPTLLPEPNHVMLNHLYALSIKDGVMVLSATHRYRKKYVTTLLYKPI